MKLSVCILAGGEGKRMKSALPKVLHLFKLKPMIVHVIEKSFKLSPERIIIVTGRYNNLIQKTIKQFIEEKYYDKLIFVIQETPMGTGHAISCTLSNYNEDEMVLILNGDTPNISSNLLQKFTNRYENRLLISVIEEPAGYGRIIMNEKDEIQKIVEEKDACESEKQINKINSGIYFVKSRDLIHYIPKITNNNKQNEYYLTDIVELIIKDKKNIKGYLIKKEENNLILGVNTIEQLNNLEKL
jgi:UDP-N-acetylglucosamine diphosphorylase/glucosamine-1-phosphate N-acetyltransferase